MAKTTVEEQQAIAKIREYVGDTFSFRIEADHIVAVDFSGPGATRETIAQLSKLTHLKSLSFGHCRDLVEGDLQPLEQLTGLENLSFHMTPVSVHSLKHIGKLKNLCFLRLYNETIEGETDSANAHPTDQGLTALTGLTKLNLLHLTGQRITDAGLIHLDRLMALRELHLFQTSTTVVGLVGFSLQHPLVEIYSAIFQFDPASESAVVEGPGASDDLFKALTKLPVVRHLHCEAIENISADGLKHLATLAKLESLRLSNCDIEDAAMASLQHAKGLKCIELWNCPSISDVGVAHLHGLELERLNLSGTRVTAD